MTNLSMQTVTPASDDLGSGLSLQTKSINITATATQCILTGIKPKMMLMYIFLKVETIAHRTRHSRLTEVN